MSSQIDMAQRRHDRLPLIVLGVDAHRPRRRRRHRCLPACEHDLVGGEDKVRSCHAEHSQHHNDGGSRERAALRGLTSDQASRLAASDFTKLLGGSNPGASMVATGSPHISRTRCFRAGRWYPFWQITFEGGSLIFESRKLGLIFCNNDPSIVAEGPTLEH